MVLCLKILNNKSLVFSVIISSIIYKCLLFHTLPSLILIKHLLDSKVSFWFCTCYGYVLLDKTVKQRWQSFCISYCIWRPDTSQADHPNLSTTESRSLKPHSLKAPNIHCCLISVSGQCKAVASFKLDIFKKPQNKKN